MMYENPGEELYFGEVYRQILQEAWLPDGGEEWHRLGKSRRGHRPADRGLTSPPLSPEQAAIRQCFSDCAAAWRDLPWELPFAPFCDNRQPRKYWMEEKARRGVMCSYYDLYMRFCMRFCLDTGCLPPVDYFIKVEPPLTNIQCNKVYSLDFTNACGDISMVSGDGFFVAPNEWVSPQCGDTGQLCFQDANGSLGWTSYTFSLAHRCTQFIWPAYNPDLIDPNVSKPIYVEGGVPPYFWTITGTGFGLADESTTNPVNTLHAGAASCGPCKIDVIDICGNECSGYVLSTAGTWVLKIEGQCVLSGCGVEDPAGTFTLITGYRKQVQLTTYMGGASCWCWPDDLPVCFQFCTDRYCIDDPLPNCIDCNPNHGFPGIITETEDCPHLRGISCYCVSFLKYYEYEC